MDLTGCCCVSCCFGKLSATRCCDNTGADVDNGGGGFGGSSLVGGLCTFKGDTVCDRNDVSLVRTCLLAVVLGAGTSFNRGGNTENGVGGTGLASCASSDGTSGKLGP